MTRMIVTTILAAAGLLGQTTINGSRRITGEWDASGATKTKPVRTATSDPAECGVGELLYRTDTASLKHCAALNTWVTLNTVYTLPTASAAVLGGVKIGNGITMTDGVISASGSEGYDIGDESVLVLRDDFFQGSASTTAMNGGALNWGLSAVASGTLSGSAGDENHPGAYTTTSHATNADSGGFMALVGPGYASPAYASVNNLDWTLTWIAKLGSASNSRTWLGLGAQSSIMPTRFVGFRYDTSTSYGDETKNAGAGSWVAQMCNGSTTCGEASGTRVVLNVAADTGWHKFQIVKAGTMYTFKVDGTARATVCPSGCDGVETPQTGNVYPIAGLGYASGGSVTSMVDFFYFRLKGMVR